MKKNPSIIIGIILLVLIASLYRVMPGRPFGFAPQIAMALFAGSIIKDKKYSFLLPLFSMLFSDILYEVLFQFKVSAMPGFYNGQLINYILFIALTVVGFKIKQTNALQIFAGSIIGASLYFILSNFVVWIGGGLDISNLPYAKSLSGLLTCYASAIPFYKMSLYATLFFNTILFGGYYIINKLFVHSPVLAKV